MFRRLSETDGSMVEVTIDGQPQRVRDGDTVAAALLSLGILANRVSDVSGAPRGPYCMMGVCFECLVTVDGVGNRQGCLVPVRAGMRIECQTTRRGIDR
jgi:predicted molibdopterin-dependent oxidoreductase YjgC